MPDLESDTINRIIQALVLDLERQSEEHRPGTPFVGDSYDQVHRTIDGDVNMRSLAIAAFRAARVERNGE